MKKALSILLACFLLLGMASIVSLADKDDPNPLSGINAAPNGSGFIPGDINNDNEVNSKDLTRLLKVLNHEKVEYNSAAADTNGDNAVNSKDLTRLLKFLNHEDVELSGGTTTPSTTPTSDTTTPSTTSTTTKTSATTTQTQPVAGTAVDLIDYIGNGSNESDKTKIVNNGSGFVINQTNGWNVWVLYYTKNAINFTPASDETLYLVYDFTVNGEGQLCLNVWDNSVAAAIAQVAGVATFTGENGAVILQPGTYTGQIAIAKTMLGETGRLGIVGTGATIRTFQLSTAKGQTAAPSVTTSTTKPTTAASTSPVATKTAPPTQANQPYITFNTSEKFGSLGCWWWYADQITNASQRKQRLDFLQQNHVTEIYLCVGGQSYAQLADFIRDAASRGMRVAWLGGDVSWINPGNTGFDGLLANFKAYQNQAAADAKFYGIHLDVEPHINGDTASNWQNYANLVMRATKAAHDYGTIIEWDIAFWIDSRTVTVNDKTQKLLDVLASNSDALTLMSYRDTTAAVLGTAVEEIPLSAKYDCRIILGLESNYTADGEFLSFAEDGRTALCNVADAVLSSLSQKGMTGGYGVAIHHVDTFMNLRP